MYSVELITDSLGFLGLEDEWNETVERANIAHPFLRHEWVRIWWDAFGAGNQLHLLVVRHRGQVAAIAPLMLEHSEMYGVPIRKLRLLFNDYTPRADVIVDAEPAIRDDAYRAIWHALVECGKSWDVVQFGQLPAESVSVSVFGRLAAEEHRSTGLWESGASPYLTITGSWREYEASLSAKFRQNLRNRLARLSRLGSPVFEILENPAEIRASLPDVERLEDSGWKRKEGTAITSNDQVRRFYELLTSRAPECPWLRVMFLAVGGRRIAAAVAAMHDRRLFLLKTGYDPEFATCSPFKLFTYFAVRHAFDAQLRELDLLGDADPWKLEWTTTTRRHEWLFLFSDTARARLLHPLKFQVLPAVKRLQSSVTCLSQLSRA